MVNTVSQELMETLNQFVFDVQFHTGPYADTQTSVDLRDLAVEALLNIIDAECAERSKAVS